MELTKLPPAARWYVKLVIGMGAAGLLAASRVAPIPWSPALAGAMLLAAALSSQKLVLVGAPGQPEGRTHLMSTLSFGFPVVLAAILGFGAGGGMLVAVASAVGASLYPRRHPLYRLAFTSVNLGVAAFLTGCLMRLLGAPLGSSMPVRFLPLMAGTLAYYLLNTGMVSVAVALSKRASLWATWCSSYFWTAPSYLAGAAVVAGMYVLQARCGPDVAILSLLCLFLVQRSYRSSLERMHQLQRGEERLQQVCLQVVESLALAIDAKDGAHDRHIRRVEQIAMAVAEELGLSLDEIQAIRIASLTHDVGKLGVPDTILAKAGRLSAEEFERMKLHVEIGVSILEPVQFPWPVVEIVRSHHERWDGGGYPAGLKGEAIPIGGRIVALADAFDALTTPRPYRTALSYEEALALIRAGSGTKFDPQVVEAFSRIAVPPFSSAEELESVPSASRGEGGRRSQAAHGRAWAEIRTASQEALSAALTDPLTGLTNARYLATALPRELEVARQEGSTLSVLMIDMDGFKAVNDNCGHLAGDSALESAARLLREGVRAESTVSRYAGDEFVILLPATPLPLAEQVADRLRARVASELAPTLSVPVGLSIGIATFPEDGDEARALLDVADRRMYADKAGHKKALLTVHSQA